MVRYTMKEPHIEAFQYVKKDQDDLPNWAVDAFDNGTIQSVSNFDYLRVRQTKYPGKTQTLASLGDWILMDKDGHLSVMPDNEFRSRYDSYSFSYPKA